MPLWTEKWTSTAKNLKLSVADNKRLCALTLDMGEFPETLAYGLPAGREQLLLLMQGNLSQVKFCPDANRYQFTAAYLGDRYMQVARTTVTEITLTQRIDSEGVVSVHGKMTIEFLWSSQDLLFFAEGLAHEMEFQLVAEQLDLPLETGAKAAA